MANNGSPGNWKQSLTIVANKICIELSEQLAWQFGNLDKSKWMDLIHPSKFNSNKSRTSHEIRAAFGQYPFAISDVILLEHNLDVLYENKEISVLLRKLTQERDQVTVPFIQQRKERQAKEVR